MIRTIDPHDAKPHRNKSSLLCCNIKIYSLYSVTGVEEPLIDLALAVLTKETRRRQLDGSVARIP
jgi:hypothetical protein